MSDIKTVKEKQSVTAIIADTINRFREEPQSFSKSFKLSSKFLSRIKTKIAQSKELEEASIKLKTRSKLNRLILSEGLTNAAEEILENAIAKGDKLHQSKRHDLEKLISKHVTSFKSIYEVIDEGDTDDMIPRCYVSEFDPKRLNKKAFSHKKYKYFGVASKNDHNVIIFAQEVVEMLKEEEFHYDIGNNNFPQADDANQFSSSTEASQLRSKRNKKLKLVESPSKRSNNDSASSPRKLMANRENKHNPNDVTYITLFEASFIDDNPNAEDNFNLKNLVEGENSLEYSLSNSNLGPSKMKSTLIEEEGQKDMSISDKKRSIIMEEDDKAIKVEGMDFQPEIEIIEQNSKENFAETPKNAENQTSEIDSTQENVQKVRKDSIHISNDFSVIKSVGLILSVALLSLVLSK